MNNVRRVALIYVRKSVVRTKQDTVSPERQRALCVAAAKERHWTPEIYEDAEGHRSGGSEKHRPAWRQMKTQIARPDVAAVIVSDLTRASRSPKDFYLFLDECQRHGVQFISLAQNIDTASAAGRVMLGVLLVMAAWEREIASERATVAIAYKRGDGRHVGLAPFGMKRGDDGLLIASEDWKACKALLEAYATGKHSYVSLAPRLNALGHRFRNRERQLVPFDRDAVRSVVNNLLVYAGYVLRTKGRRVDAYVPVASGDDMLESLAQHAKAIRGQHEPLIDAELANRIIAARRAHYNPPVSDARRVFVLYPRLYCAACGSHMRGITLRGQSRYAHAGKSCHPYLRGVYEAGELERQVLERLSALRLSDDDRAIIRARFAERIGAQPDRAAVEAQIRAMQGKIARLRELYVEGDIDRTAYDARLRESQAALDALRAQVPDDSARLESVLDRIDTIADVLSGASPAEQRRAIGELIERIEVDTTGRISKMTVTPWVAEIFGALEATPNGTSGGT